MRFGLLGPLTLADDAGAPVPVGGARLRTLLAALLLQANTPVAWETLAEAVWDGAPLPTAAHTLRSHVLRLRRALGAEAGRLMARDPGYMMRVQPGELDAVEFEEHCQRAAAALQEGAWAHAAQVAARALALWRGEPLLDIPSQVLRDRFTPRLAQLHLQLLEDRAEADLHLGRHEQLVPQLRELTSAHPLRERFQAQLVTALAGAGRRAEALEAYQAARRVLVEELGVEPGPQLRDLHGRILAGGDAQPSAKPQAERALSNGVAGTVPRQLPAAPGHFTGRRGELEQLAELTHEADATAAAAGGMVVISAIDGMAGIGKTALAVHAAHRLSEQFPGGQLFLDLHGHTKGYPAREQAEALDWLLRALGVPAKQIPADPEARAALYRQRLAGTRSLIVLDNAGSEAQVRPLLPGVPGCLVLVTSRRRLKGLDDAHSLSLDVLPSQDAVMLLRAVAGPDRIPDGDPLADQIAQLCGYLPLALRIAGALLRHRPASNLRQFAELLRDQPQRVRALSDGERDLGAVFDLSYTALGERHRLMFRRLGLVPGPDIDAYAAAALLGCTPDAATGLLEDLVDHNLLIAHAAKRYRLHDLIRSHARALADQDPAPDRDAAIDRLLHYYAHTAQRASVPIARILRSAPPGPAPAHGPALTGPDEARAWLRAERDNLQSACAHARASGLDRHTVALAAGLAEILLADGPFARALDLHQTAVETARRQGESAAQALALTDLGTVRHLTGDLPGAVDALTRALEIFRGTDHRRGEAVALTDLGIVRCLTGDLPRAADALTRALEIFREIDHRQGEAAVLAELGRVRQMTGDLPGATEAHTRVLEIIRMTGNRTGEAGALIDLGLMRRLAGDLTGAADAYTQALKISVAAGNPRGEAYALTELGTVRRLAGDLAGADDVLTRALEIIRSIGHRGGEAIALTELGTVRRLAGDLAGADDVLTRALEFYRANGHRGNEAWALNHYAATVAATGPRSRALTLYQQALAMNRELNKPDDEAISLEGIAEHHIATGDIHEGTAHLHQALEIYQRLGMRADAERITTRLATLNESDEPDAP